MSRLGFWIYTFWLLLRGSRVIEIDGKYYVLHFFENNDGYMATAHSNCGSTKDHAQEMAIYKLKHFMAR